VAGVADDQVKVQRPSEIHGQLDLRYLLDLNVILGISTLGASSIGTIARSRDRASHAVIERVYESAIVLVAAIVSRSSHTLGTNIVDLFTVTRDAHLSAL
jgi:hypothetical protein